MSYICFGHFRGETNLLCRKLDKENVHPNFCHTYFNFNCKYFTVNFTYIWIFTKGYISLCSCSGIEPHPHDPWSRAYNYWKDLCSTIETNRRLIVENARIFIPVGWHGSASQTWPFSIVGSGSQWIYYTIINLNKFFRNSRCHVVNCLDAMSQCKQWCHFYLRSYGLGSRIMAHL